MLGWVALATGGTVAFLLRIYDISIDVGLSLVPLLIGLALLPWVAVEWALDSQAIRKIMPVRVQAPPDLRAILAELARIKSDIWGNDSAKEASSESPPIPVLKVDVRQAMLSGIREGAFVQLFAGVRWDGALEFRVTIAASGLESWNFSQQGQIDLTLDKSQPRLVGGTGDASFDIFVSLFGPRPGLLASMSNDLRCEILSLLGDYWGTREIFIGPPVIRLRGRRAELISEDSEPFPPLLDSVRAGLQLVKRLHTSPKQIIQALYLNALNEPCVGVRQCNLEVLASEFPNSDEAVKATAAALQDQDDRMRVAGAALTAGEDGFAELSRLLGSDRVVPEVRTCPPCRRDNQNNPSPWRPHRAGRRGPRCVP